MAHGDGAHHVAMRGLPTTLYGRYTEHVERVAYAAVRVLEDGAADPALRRAVDVILERFGVFRERNRRIFETAQTRGDRTVEFVFEAPPQMAGDSLEFLDAVEELDMLARRGEVVAQIEHGQEPQPYRE